MALVTFGNRSYDSSLTELRDELEKKDFLVFAAGAFAAPHAFAAIGREHPTEEDRARSGSCWTGRKPGSGAENPWSGS